MLDPALNGHATKIYVWLHERLDTRQLRAVKYFEIERALTLHKMTVHDALGRLIARGYLKRVRRGRVMYYRLAYSPRPSVLKPYHEVS